jgi:hypothetical protein
VRRIARTRRPVHALELFLKRFIEYLVPVLSEESKQRSHTRQPFH